MRDPRVYHVAVLMLKRGQALPLDVQTALMAAGYDVSALTARYGL